MMIRFLDLTLLLLMAFLLEADLSIELEVGLPHGDPDESVSSEREMWTMTLQPASFSVMSSMTNICNGSNANDFYTCLVTSPSPPDNLVVTPASGVQVQRMVNILDVCSRAQIACSAGGI